MRMNPYLSVIVPAYNEEKRISKTLGAIHHYLLEQPFEWEILIVLDGPNDHTLSEVEGFARGNDIIICSRDEKDAEGAKQVVSQPIYKRLIGNMGNLFIQLVAVPGIWDTQCGFKAVRAPAAEKIFSVAKIDRWGFDIEVLALARHFGFTIGIVPAQWIDDAASHVTLGGYLGVFFQTLQIRWNLIIKTYDRAS